MSVVSLTQELEDLNHILQTLNSPEFITKYPLDADKKVELINMFLTKINANLFGLDCLHYASFFNTNKILVSNLISSLQEVIKIKLMIANNSTVFKLSDNLEIFISIKDMLLEFNEIFYNLIPNIREELHFESKELRKLVAFNKIDLEDNKYTEEYTIDQLLELAKTGGNSLFFSRSNRSSTISEKRLSLLSTPPSTRHSSSKRKHMPIFLSKRDMMIFEDLLEIEKLNEALFRSLRELLSEKIEIFNNKHNSKKSIFEELINVIKNAYLILDNEFEELTYLLKTLEQKVTVYRWVHLIDKLFEECLQCINIEIFSLQENVASLKEGILLIQKHICFFETLLVVSWDDYLIEKITSYKKILISDWEKTKQNLKIAEDEPNVKEINNKTKVSKEKPFKRMNSRKSLASNEKQGHLTRDEKRQSVGAAIFQKLNLRASLIYSEDQLKSPKKLQEDINEETEDNNSAANYKNDSMILSIDNTDLFLNKTQSLYVSAIQSEQLKFGPLIKDQHFKQMDDKSSFRNKSVESNFNNENSGSLVDSTASKLPFSNENLINEKYYSKLIIKQETLLKYAKIKSKIAKNESLLESLLGHGNTSSLSLSSQLLKLEAAKMELVFDTNRAYSVYNTVKSKDFELADLLTYFRQMTIKISKEENHKPD